MPTEAITKHSNLQIAIKSTSTYHIKTHLSESIFSAANNSPSHKIKTIKLTTYKSISKGKARYESHQLLFL